jgi:hypothetical protein
MHAYSCVGSQARTQRLAKGGGFTLPEDVVRWEANHTHGERLWVRRQRRLAWSATRVVMRARGEDTPSELESLRGDDEEE